MKNNWVKRPPYFVPLITKRTDLYATKLWYFARLLVMGISFLYDRAEARFPDSGPAKALLKSPDLSVLAISLATLYIQFIGIQIMLEFTENIFRGVYRVFVRHDKNHH